MKWCIAALLSASVALAPNSLDATQSRYQPQGALVIPIPKVFASALSEVKAKSTIPVLLPSELPQSIAKAKYSILRTASRDEYAIALYYKLGVGDSGFAAFFGAKVHPGYRPNDMPNVREVKLSRGMIGYFRPVSCGGSYAPANLWWEDGGILYQVQLELSSTFPEGKQQRVITAVANSAILAGPR